MQVHATEKRLKGLATSNRTGYEASHKHLTYSTRLRILSLPHNATKNLTREVLLRRGLWPRFSGNPLRTPSTGLAGGRSRGFPGDGSPAQGGRSRERHSGHGSRGVRWPGARPLFAALRRRSGEARPRRGAAPGRRTPRRPPLAPTRMAPRYTNPPAHRLARVI